MIQFFKLTVLNYFTVSTGFEVPSLKTLIHLGYANKVLSINFMGFSFRAGKETNIWR